MLYPRRTPKPSRPKAAPVPPALAILIQDGQHELPRGGFVGEFAPIVEPVVAQPAQPFTIEPWPEEERRAAIEGAAPEQELSATVSVIPAAELPGVGPPVQYEPVRRPEFPAPDWELEEQERRSREAAELALKLEAPEPPERPTYPALALRRWRR
jgi:hypothetical protein